MSEKKGEVEGGSKAEDSKEIVEDKKSKTKRESSKKAKHNNSVEEDSNENSKETASPENKKTKATKSKKVAKKSDEAENQNDEEEEEHDDIDVKKKIPLLDQPPIIEGSRQRTCVLKFEQKQPNQKAAVSVPAGKGKPLGRIPIVNQRLKRLRIVTVKNLHRLIFGRIGKISLVLSNIQKFNGFPFLEDSDDYNRKVTALNKLPKEELKELLFSFDLDMKIKKKDECAKEILNFLISPRTSEKTQNPSLSHPKRKATKRNYYDADVEEEDNKKRRKPKPAADSKKEKSSEDDESTKATAKSSKTNDKSSNDDASKKSDDQDSSNELKKPAKKRKRNQIIEEEENKKSKSQDEKSEDEKKDEGDDEDSEDGSATSDSQSPAQKSGNAKDKLSDEELKIFLKKVLADLNLENTTMKTVFNLISSEYPTYDFSKKKRFIKGVVKSLIQ